MRCFAEQVIGGLSDIAVRSWITRHTPKLPELPQPDPDPSTGRVRLPDGGGLLLWEFEELIARVALRMYRSDLSTTPQQKVNEVCQLLRARTRPLPPPPRHAEWQERPPPSMEYAYVGGDGGANSKALMRPSLLIESSSNAARVQAVRDVLGFPKPVVCVGSTARVRVSSRRDSSLR